MLRLGNRERGAAQLFVLAAPIVCEGLSGGIASSARNRLDICVTSPMRSLAANASYSRIVLGAEVTLGGFTATAPDLCVE